MSVWTDIVSQVDNLRAVIEKQEAGSRTNMEKAARILTTAGRITYAGVGSGLNATIPACVYLMAHGIPSQYIDATELTYDLFPGIQGSALILNTRSGETVELIKLAETAQKASIPTIAVTNEPESTVGRMSDVCLSTFSRWDDLVVISAYGGMVATELLLAGYVTGEPDSMLKDLKGTAAKMQSAFDSALENRQKACALLSGDRPIYLLGRGASIASTLGGTLALEEIARQSAIPMAGGLFRQGPIEVVDDRFAAILFEGAGQPASLTLSLGQDLLSMGSKIYWIGSTPLPGAINLTLPKLPGYVLPLLEIIPVQMLAFDLAEKKGYAPGTVKYIQKVITTETGLPNQQKGM